MLVESDCAGRVGVKMGHGRLFASVSFHSTGFFFLGIRPCTMLVIPHRVMSQGLSKNKKER